MKKEVLFKGVATALVTPLTDKGVDYDAFDRLIEFQIEGGVSALVICGTTGEASTLGDEEHLNVIGHAVKRVGGRITVIGGTGSNDTAHAIMMTKRACDMGVDGCLVVTPYYNKTTQSGLIASYTAIADASDKPIILYNIPVRTALNIEPATYAALADHPRIAAIKEGNANIEKIVETFRLVGDKLAIYSGNDDHVVPMLSMGGMGVISTTSNIAPKAMVQMCERFFAGDVAGSARMQMDYLPLMHALFSQTNPIPVKAALNRMGYCEDILRLPLIPMEEPHRSRLFVEMEKLGL